MKTLTVCMILTATLFSCAPLYRPTTIYAPMFTEKGDMSGSVNTGINNLDANAAFALTKNWAVLTNISYTKWESTLNTNYRKNLHIEFAPGLYSNLGSGFVSEIFGGFGIGHVESRGSFSAISNKVSGNFSKYFLQPSIGFTSEVVDFILHSRLTVVSFNNIRDENNVFVFRDAGIHAFLEPAISLRLGYQYVKFCTQLGFAAPITNINYDFNPLIFSMGLQIDIRKAYREDKLGLN